MIGKWKRSKHWLRMFAFTSIARLAQSFHKSTNIDVYNVISLAHFISIMRTDWNKDCKQCDHLQFFFIVNRQYLSHLLRLFFASPYFELRIMHFIYSKRSAFTKADEKKKLYWFGEKLMREIPKHARPLPISGRTTHWKVIVRRPLAMRWRISELQTSRISHRGSSRECT